MSTKKYQVHFEQVNDQWVEVEATSPAVAIRKARKVWIRLNDPGTTDDKYEPRTVEKISEVSDGR